MNNFPAQADWDEPENEYRGIRNYMASATAPSKTRSRYALVGAGHRAQMYIDAISRRFAGSAELLAWSDTNPGRLDFYDELMAARDIESPARYEPSQLPAMIKDLDIDTVVVTSPDFTHAAVIETCLRAGADVVVEKPLTIDAAGCARIAAAVRETGRQVTVTFNYRYSPRNSALKEVVASGEIGTVTSVNFEWVLDTVHGADYFRRWHREKAKSGGLLIHKASHHFDLVNWWIDDQPNRVYASGGLRFYGAANARKRGLGERPERGTGDGPRTDPFAMDLREDERLRRLYLDNEHHDGYLRDRDVFADGITIEDNLAVVVDYAGGPTLNYSLNAHSPWEGYRVAINGTRGPRRTRSGGARGGGRGCQGARSQRNRRIRRPGPDPAPRRTAAGATALGAGARGADRRLRRRARRW